MNYKDVKAKDVTVYETRDYSRFKKIKGNRALNKGQLKKMALTIKGDKINIMSAAPILVDDSYSIVDGQHRFHVCKDLKLPIYYIKNGSIKIQGIAKLNSNTSTWKGADYIKCYCSLGNEHYKKLKRFIETYPVPVSSAVGLMMTGKARLDGTQYKNAFKDGDFKCNYLVFAQEVGQMVEDLKPHIGRVTMHFIAALCSLNRSDKYDHETMMKKLKSKGNIINQQERKKSWIIEIEKAYNFHNQKLIRIV